MSDYVMQNFGFTPLDQTARCVVTGGKRQTALNTCRALCR